MTLVKTLPRLELYVHGVEDMLSALKKCMIHLGSSRGTGHSGVFAARHRNSLKNTLRTEIDFKDSCELKLVQEPVSHEEPKAAMEIPFAPFPHGFSFL